jgi:hypothetical protein
MNTVLNTLIEYRIKDKVYTNSFYVYAQFIKR